MESIVFQIQDGDLKFQSIRSRIKIQDGRHKFQPIRSRIKIEDDRHKFQPIRSSHATSKLILTVSYGLKRQRSVRQVAMMKTIGILFKSIMARWHHREPIGDNDDVMASQSPLIGRALSSRPFPFPSHLPRFHAGMFNEMYHTVSNSSSSCKVVIQNSF